LATPIRKKQLKSPGDIRQNEHEDNAGARRCLLVDEVGDPVNDTNPLPIDGTIQVEAIAGKSPQIYNVSAPVANQEYSQALPAGTVKFLIRPRKVSKVKFSFAAGTSGTNYITIPPGNSYDDPDLNLTGKTLYFQCNKPNQTFEILAWTSS